MCAADEIAGADVVEGYVFGLGGPKKLMQRGGGERSGKGGCVDAANAEGVEWCTGQHNRHVEPTTQGMSQFSRYQRPHRLERDALFAGTHKPHMADEAKVVHNAQVTHSGGVLVCG